MMKRKPRMMPVLSIYSVCVVWSVLEGVSKRSAKKKKEKQIQGLFSRKTTWHIFGIKIQGTSVKREQKMIVKL